ncbi:hypothetical protein ABID19_005909 [Mesorhizobium robiniae]|uniref:Uncharacterized protein n=1 Tax=Mesorhizobium robiniae TaxID=559315 RepID=A0ABV2GXR9_9HYPH
MKKHSNFLFGEPRCNSRFGQLNENFLGGAAPEVVCVLSVPGLQDPGNTFDQFPPPMQRKRAYV